MEKKVVLILIILMIATGIIFSIFYFESNKSSNENGPLGESNLIEYNSEGGDIQDTNRIDANGEVSGGGSGTGASSQDPNPGVDNENKTLPSDFYTISCGFYFDEYDRCGGSCPEGSCVSEGRSCYCKK